MSMYEGIVTKTLTVYPVKANVPGAHSIWVAAGTLVLAEPVDTENIQITTRRQGEDYIAVVNGGMVVCGAERVPAEKETN